MANPRSKDPAFGKLWVLDGVGEGRDQGTAEVPGGSESGLPVGGGVSADRAPNALPRCVWIQRVVPKTLREVDQVAKIGPEPVLQRPERKHAAVGRGVEPVARTAAGKLQFVGAGHRAGRPAVGQGLPEKRKHLFGHGNVKKTRLHPSLGRDTARAGY